MSNQQHYPDSSKYSASERLFLCLFPSNRQLASSLSDFLSRDRYKLKLIELASDLQEFIEQHKEQIDCLIFIKDSSFEPILTQLVQQGILLPIVIIDSTKIANHNEHDSFVSSFSEGFNCLKNKIYHNAEVCLANNQVEQIASVINIAITKFLNLAPNCILEKSASETQLTQNYQSFLLLQQRRLAEKLKERLGYLGIYYKRNSQDFYRNLSQAKKQELFRQLSSEYRQIILSYFNEEQDINKLIDQFVNQAFFADLSVSQILEMHMELMDEFAQQLKLEGRNEEILLDYRLALIDIIAHLCEMYRRSIPREDLPLDLFFRLD
ncbi:KaiA family protein [Stanieria cyanosphaera PCC 7437]|uniref:Circadian clock oscillator protein KaiA n=1 Tax=Stanieria cyanosphaera (strain ATCC 29371 / PCC 7437) TaxID=111780 RepID=K9XN65_STAC7|nr:circadian clock protein KaiA [Stanieria cyanosphaera]AFZ33973.1 KaiA family protein [Stanieria cyanosphaera PCC 7437]